MPGGNINHHWWNSCDSNIANETLIFFDDESSIFCGEVKQELRVENQKHEL